MSDVINSEIIRGHIDTMILRILIEGDNYGYEIMKSINQYSNGNYELKEPSLYTSLKRLEKNQSIKSYWGDETQGGRRKYYTITEQGLTNYEEAVKHWQLAKKIISLLIERSSNNE